MFLGLTVERFLLLAPPLPGQLGGLCGLWAPSCPEGLSHQGITGHQVHKGPGLAPELSAGGSERERKVEPEVINLGRLPGKGEFRAG